MKEYSPRRKVCLRRGSAGEGRGSVRDPGRRKGMKGEEEIRVQGAGGRSTQSGVMS